MKIIKDLKLAKELIKFPSITPIDSGVMKFLEKKFSQSKEIRKAIEEIGQAGTFDPTEKTKKL